MKLKQLKKLARLFKIKRKINITKLIKEGKGNKIIEVRT